MAIYMNADDWVDQRFPNCGRIGGVDIELQRMTNNDAERFGFGKPSLADLINSAYQCLDVNAMYHLLERVIPNLIIDPDWFPQILEDLDREETLQLFELVFDLSDDCRLGRLANGHRICYREDK